MDIFGEVFLAYCCFGPSPILIVRLMPCGCCVCVCVCVGGGMFWWIHSDLLVLFYSKSHGYASFTLIPDIKIIALRRRCCGCSIMTRRRDESRSKSNLLNIKQWSSKECWEIHFQLRSNSRATGNSHKNN